MKNGKIGRVCSMVLICFFCVGQMRAQPVNKLPGKADDRVLIASGGGARGAWGVGLVQALVAVNGRGYKAVFGTSTGSLMAPYVLLGSIHHEYFDSLEILYTHVTQNSIFNVSPFKLTVKGTTVQSKMKSGVILHRFLCGKTTFGESLNLRSLIHNHFTQAQYDLIKNQHQYLAVAVTNMSTGDVEVISASQAGSADSMCNWIWASACEPLWMSYYYATSPATGKPAYFVDGGVRDVVPIQQGIKYAVDNHIPNVDVIVNNGRQTLDDNWSPTALKPHALQGLIRLLQVYNAGTIAKDTLVGDLMTQLVKCAAGCNDCRDSLQEQLISDEADYAMTGHDSSDETLTINLYFMDNALAATYRDELAFAPQPMQALVDDGKSYFTNAKNKGNTITYKISSKRFKTVFKHLYKKKS